jgi:hypothetical protein
LKRSRRSSRISVSESESYECRAQGASYPAKAVPIVLASYGTLDGKAQVLRLSYPSLCLPNSQPWMSWGKEPVPSRVNHPFH